jgi:hypothetical protein
MKYLLIIWLLLFISSCGYDEVTIKPKPKTTGIMNLSTQLQYQIKYSATDTTINLKKNQVREYIIYDVFGEKRYPAISSDGFSKTILNSFGKYIIEIVDTNGLRADTSYTFLSDGDYFLNLLIRVDNSLGDTVINTMIYNLLGTPGITRPDEPGEG